MDRFSTSNHALEQFYGDDDEITRDMIDKWQADIPARFAAKFDAVLAEIVADYRAKFGDDAPDLVLKFRGFEDQFADYLSDEIHYPSDEITWRE